jgi:hypothetical protein
MSRSITIIIDRTLSIRASTSKAAVDKAALALCSLFCFDRCLDLCLHLRLWTVSHQLPVLAANLSPGSLAMVSSEDSSEEDEEKAEETHGEEDEEAEGERGGAPSLPRRSLTMPLTWLVQGVVLNPHLHPPLLTLSSSSSTLPPF